MPTSLLVNCIDSILPFITKLVNESLRQSHVPVTLKEAVVRPLLKKPKLSREELKNYRPVSNLPYISKLLEKVVASRLDNHLESNQLHEAKQSAYRSCHSTETALLKVHHDIVMALDEKCYAVLVLLDLSAAFDVIDHSILLQRLEHSFGISGSAVSWIKSYLSDRVMRVAVGDAYSDDQPVTFGVPQGSVLGPKMYCMYTKPVGEICRQHGMLYHCYADDTQVYLVISPNTVWQDSKTRIEKCLSDISVWMLSNLLKLNHDKTELIVFSSKHHSDDLSGITITFDGSTIRPVPVVKNLGAFFDETMSMGKQSSAVSKSCFFHLSKIGRIRHLINESACKTLVHSIVTSRLDYANGLLYGTTDRTLNKLQVVQNAAARLVTRTRKREHITPVLAKLHWLPVNYRIQYKILVCTYKAIHQIGPEYLNELVTPYCPSRSLRSESTMQLQVPQTKTKFYGDRRFDKSSALLWNSLPIQLRQVQSLDTFKRALKTHLFKQAFR